jgi:hypothetical protein
VPATHNTSCIHHVGVCGWWAWRSARVAEAFLLLSMGGGCCQCSMGSLVEDRWCVDRLIGRCDGPLLGSAVGRFQSNTSPRGFRYYQDSIRIHRTRCPSLPVWRNPCQLNAALVLKVCRPSSVMLHRTQPPKCCSCHPMLLPFVAAWLCYGVVLSLPPLCDSGCGWTLAMAAVGPSRGCGWHCSLSKLTGLLEASPHSRIWAILWPETSFWYCSSLVLGIVMLVKMDERWVTGAILFMRANVLHWRAMSVTAKQRSQCRESRKRSGVLENLIAWHISAVFSSIHNETQNIIPEPGYRRVIHFDEVAMVM